MTVRGRAGGAAGYSRRSVCRVGGLCWVAGDRLPAVGLRPDRAHLTSGRRTRLGRTAVMAQVSPLGCPRWVTAGVRAARRVTSGRPTGRPAAPTTLGRTLPFEGRPKGSPRTRPATRPPANPGLSGANPHGLPLPAGTTSEPPMQPDTTPRRREGHPTPPGTRGCAAEIRNPTPPESRPAATTARRQTSTPTTGRRADLQHSQANPRSTPNLPTPQTAADRRSRRRRPAGHPCPTQPGTRGCAAEIRNLTTPESRPAATTAQARVRRPERHQWRAAPRTNHPTTNREGQPRPPLPGGREPGEPAPSTQPTGWVARPPSG